MTKRQFGENLDDWAVKTSDKKEIPKSKTAQTLFDEAKRLSDSSRDNEALTLINIAIENDGSDYDYLNLKADILEKLSRYSEAAEAYDSALNLSGSDEIKKNKAVMLYKWANSLNDKNKALGIIEDAISILPETFEADYREKFWYLKGSILDCMGQNIESRICYLKAEGFTDQIAELENQIDYIKSAKETLISITGTRFYYGIEVFEKGLAVNLVREPENEHDPDAIRVEIDGEKVGYVANSEYTLIDNINSASDIKLMDFEKAEVVFVFMDEYVIAKLTG